MREVTIYDIAEKAKVSASTVSRVINNKPGVKRATKARIMKIVEEYHYVPNETARGLVRQSSKIIGILLSDIRTMHHTDGVYYMERELTKQGFSCLIYNTGVLEQEQTDFIRVLSQRKVEAAVLMGSIYQTDAIKEAIQTYMPTTPVIIFNGYLDLPNVYGMVADEQNGVFNCVKYLADKGRKQLAFMIDNKTPSGCLKRIGFESGVHEFCDGNAPMVIETHTDIQSEYDATYQLLLKHPEIDGIIYSDDLLAMVGLRVLADMHIAVPDRVAVIGINNSKYAEISIPKLTSLDNMLYDLSITGVRNIMALLQGEHVNKKMILCSKIVAREST